MSNTTDITRRWGLVPGETTWPEALAKLGVPAHVATKAEGDNDLRIRLAAHVIAVTKQLGEDIEAMTDGGEPKLVVLDDEQAKQIAAKALDDLGLDLSELAALKDRIARLEVRTRPGSQQLHPWDDPHAHKSTAGARDILGRRSDDQEAAV